MTDPLGALLDDLEARSGVTPSGAEFGDPLARRFKSLLDHYSLPHAQGIVGPADADTEEVAANIGAGGGGGGAKALTLNGKVLTLNGKTLMLGA